MSIAYGHFSSALNSSASTGLVNSVGTIYFTVPWHSGSYIDRIRIYNSTSSVKQVSSIAILSNAAHTRYADNLILDDGVYYDGTAVTPSAASLYGAYYNLNPAVYYEEAYGRPYLYIKVILGANASNDYYYCTVSGRKASGSSQVRNDSTHISKNKNYSAVILKKADASGLGNTVYDVTQNALSNAVNQDNTSIFNIDDSRDYIYVGSEKKVDHWEFQVGTASTNAGALSGQYWWAGSAWSSFTVLDNTSSDGTGSLRFSGIIEGAGLGSSAWVPTILNTALNANLPTDIASSIGNSINNGLIYPTTMFNNPPRYWARFKVASISDVAKFKAILPVDENY